MSGRSPQRSRTSTVASRPPPRSPFVCKSSKQTNAAAPEPIQRRQAPCRARSFRAGVAAPDALSREPEFTSETHTGSYRLPARVADERADSGVNSPPTAAARRPRARWISAFDRTGISLTLGVDWQ
jgi:hypothetical protein